MTFMMPFTFRALQVLLVLFLSFAGQAAAASPFETTKDLPIAFQGRFRSLDSAARIWLYDLYHLDRLKQEHLTGFQTEQRSALDLLWKVHFTGHAFLDKAPLFWIHLASLKSLLGIDPLQSRFSYDELNQAIYQDQEGNLRMVRYLLLYEFAKAYRSPANRSKSEKLEMRHLAPGLWVAIRKNELVVAASPSHAPWHFIHPGMHIADMPINFEFAVKQNKRLSEDFLQLIQTLQEYENFTGSQLNNEVSFEEGFRRLKQQSLNPREIAKNLEENHPLHTRLQKAGSTLKMLPSRNGEGEWFSLHALTIKRYDQNLQALVPVENFTLFSDEQFEKIRRHYKELESAALQLYTHYFEDGQQLDAREHLAQAVDRFSQTMSEAYRTIAGMPYKEASSKSLNYPSFWQLRAETLYYRLPLIEISLIGYAAALLLFLTAYTLGRKSLDFWAGCFLLLAFIFHTTILVLRCYVLQRPPVSNMYETVIYVPWIAMIVGFCLQRLLSSRIPIIAACAASLALLILLKLSYGDVRLENVQAVLDSQYWLIVHVLMIVASYGIFIVSGVLGHYFLFSLFKNRQEDTTLRFIAKCILQTMYIGIALLIPGTILGGVWAAESWGRFWDWDPKESWAFISACIYLLIIHAYTFRKIHDIGLAIGSIFGLMSISFTWYGVNYILGTGLHSYGFGNGGERYYFGYLAIELIIIAGVSTYLFFKPRKTHKTS